MSNDRKNYSDLKILNKPIQCEILSSRCLAIYPCFVSLREPDSRETWDAKQKTCFIGFIV